MSSRSSISASLASGRPKTTPREPAPSPGRSGYAATMRPRARRAARDPRSGSTGAWGRSTRMRRSPAFRPVSGRRPPITAERRSQRAARSWLPVGCDRRWVMAPAYGATSGVRRIVGRAASPSRSTIAQIAESGSRAPAAPSARSPTEWTSRSGSRSTKPVDQRALDEPAQALAPRGAGGRRASPGAVGRPPRCRWRRRRPRPGRSRPRGRPRRRSPPGDRAAGRTAAVGPCGVSTTTAMNAACSAAASVGRLADRPDGRRAAVDQDQHPVGHERQLLPGDRVLELALDAPGDEAQRELAQRRQVRLGEEASRARPGVRSGG